MEARKITDATILEYLDSTFHEMKKICINDVHEILGREFGKVGREAYRTVKGWLWHYWERGSMDSKVIATKDDLRFYSGDGL